MSVTLSVCVRWGRFAVRQMVNHELKLESIRRSSRGIAHGEASAMDTDDRAEGGAGGGKRGREEVGSALVDKYTKMQRKKTAGSKGRLHHFDVLYRYNEGFTNAVGVRDTLALPFCDLHISMVQV